MSNGSGGGCGALIGMASLVLMLTMLLTTCSSMCSGGGHFTDGGKSGNNPYQPGTTNFERYERIFN